jgi:hypothetical protein
VLEYFEAHECSAPYLIGVSHNEVHIAVDVLYVNGKTNQSYIKTDHILRRLADVNDEDLFCNVF